LLRYFLFFKDWDVVEQVIVAAFELHDKNTYEVIPVVLFFPRLKMIISLITFVVVFCCY
jgi:hypothetical protein